MNNTMHPTHLESVLRILIHRRNLHTPMRSAIRAIIKDDILLLRLLRDAMGRLG